MIVWHTEVDKSLPPEFLTRPKPTTVPEGSHNATFTCRVQGHPLPAVSWERNGCQLSGGERYKISREGEQHSLEIVKPTASDSGQYVCLVHNAAGTTTHNCSLIVTEATTTKGNNNNVNNVNNNNNNKIASSSPASAGTTDFRGLLKPRQGDARSQRSTADPDPRPEKEHHDFRHVLRKNSRQLPPPSSTTTTTTLSNSPSIAASSRFSLQNGSSMQSSLSTASSLSSVSSSVSNRSGIRKNLEVFENRASPPSDKSALTSSSRLTPDDRPSPEKSGIKSRNLPSSEPRSSPVRDVSGMLDRKTPDHELESALTSTTVQPSQAMLANSRERPKERSVRDPKTNSTHTSSKSLDRAKWRKSELSTTETSKPDFRSVLSKGKSVTEHSKVVTDSSSKQQPKVDFRSVLSKGKSVGEHSTGKAVVTDSSKSPKTDFRSVLSKGKSVTEQSKNVTESSSKPPKTDFRSVLPKDKSVTEQNKDVTDASKPFKLRPSPARDSEKNNKDAKQSPSINQLDFRNVLKSRPTDDSKTPVVKRDNKPKVQSTKSEIDFRSVLTKRNKEATDDVKKQPTESKTAQYRDSPERTTALKDSSSTDRSKLPSRFESPSQDANELPSEKKAEPTSNPTTTTATTISSNQSDTPTTTASRWREEKGERPVVKVTDNTVNDEDHKPPDVISSLSDASRFDTSRFSDDLKCSDSSQLSDSAISSAFSKLSEMSDLSDSSSAVSEEPLEPRISSSRRRLERLKERLGTGGGSGESEGVVEGVLEAPSVQQHLADCSVLYGGQVVLQCKVTGVPAPDISWSVNHKAIKPSQFFQLSYQENLAQLRMAEAFSEDEGEYTCTATNSAGTDSSSCYLTVEASSSRSSRSGSHVFEGPVSTPPHVGGLTPSSLTVRRGQPASFQLTFSGAPTPVVTWCKGKTLLQTDDCMSVTKETGTSTLTLSSVSANDTGRYTVTVSNDLGSDRLSATLSVEDVPECPVGTPHVYDISRKSVSLSWCGPAYDGGSVVTHYVVEVKESGSDKWTTLEDACTSTSYHALTLKADTPYQFRVRAANRLGLSDPSLPTPPVTMVDPLQTCEDYESDDELPFEPREVTLKPGRKFEDHFEYLNEVGRGKFGSVYKCRDKESGKIWAAKVLKVRERDKAGVRQEVEVMNHLAHPKLLMLWDAFEAPRTMVLIMEFVGAGELFERVIRDDFVLTERDCMHFVRQICSGVGYMHSKNIVHLDLKPENVLCVAENSNQIKIIDFGLARFYKPGDSLQVLFGTPEFIAPEVINYDAISFSTDMWSIGVICYILLSGLSPFQGDSDAETLANVTSGEYDFDDESFDEVSDKSKDFIGGLLVKRKEKRMTIAECEKHRWMSEEDKRIRCKRLNTDRLRNFMARRKWQKTGNAIRALGRMASMQKLLSGGSSSQGSTGSVSSVPDTPSGAGPPHDSGGGNVSTPVFSPAVKTLNTAHPLAGATVKEEEEEKGEETGTATTTPNTTTTTTTTSAPGENSQNGGDKGKEDSKLTPNTNGGELTTTTVAASKAATTETANVTADVSPFSWRRRQKEGGLEDCAPPPPPSSTSLRSKLTKQDALQSLDVADSGQKTADDDKHAPTATDTNIDKLSPSQTQQEKVPPKEEDDEASKREPCPPSFVKEMVDCTAFAGDVVRFDVTVTGFPAPTIVWRLEEEEVEEDNRHVIELGEHGQCSLIVRHVEEDDEGEYLCEAVNSQGEASCSAELSVYSLGAM